MDSKFPGRKVDTGINPNFDLTVYNERMFVGVPSQGTDKSAVLTAHPSEMAYEQRGVAFHLDKTQSGLLVTRKQFPPAEVAYLRRLFHQQHQLPELLVLEPDMRHWNVPLDKLIMADPGKLRELQMAVEDLQQRTGEQAYLNVFNQTQYSAKIAEELGIPFYGNHRFAEWAGTKSGLVEFLSECDVLTPATHKVESFDGLEKAILDIERLGYPSIVVKLDYSTGGMGHKKTEIHEALRLCREGDYGELLPEGFGTVESAVVQGWIPDALSVSIGIFVDFDGSFKFTSAQQHLLQEDEHGHALGAIGSVPLDEAHLQGLLANAHKIVDGYVRHQAYGPHTMGFIVPSDDWCDILGFPPGSLLACDENSRPGRTTHDMLFMGAVRSGVENIGTGWVTSNISVDADKNMRIEHVIAKMRANGLLLEEVGPNTEGVFIYGGLVFNTRNGKKPKFFAISLADDSANALAQLQATKQLFGES